MVFNAADHLTSLVLNWSWRQGYEVHGIIRRSSSFNTGRIEHMYKDRHGDDVREHETAQGKSQTSSLTL